MSNVLLGVNIDHVATLRNVRGGDYPDPVYAAFIAEQSGADSITIHLREDRRHIKDRDVKLLRQTIQTAMNLEIAATDEMINIVCELKPDYCCLVPERRQELTTEGGLDIVNYVDKLQDVISQLIVFGIRVSLFINPEIDQIDAACSIRGVNCIELHTGMYACATDQETRRLEYQRIQKGVQHANNCGLRVHAGHGLNYHNVQPIAMITGIKELNIGHSIISRSLFCGLFQAVKDMKELLDNC